MDLAQRTVARPALLAAAACLLALFALVLPGRAEAGVRVVAKEAGSPAGVAVTARTSFAARRVDFLVDGRRRPLTRSVSWRHGRRGVLRVGALRPGRHRVVALAVRARGRVSRGVEVIHIARKRDGNRFGLKLAKKVASEPKETRTQPAGVLFDGGFDDGFESWYVQALDYRVGIFGEGALRGSAAHFEVHDGDVEPDTGSERAEVSGPSFNEGQDLYVRDSIRVPSSSNSDTGWQLIQQLREHDWGGSPGMAVFLEDDREIEIGAGDSWPMYWEGPELETDRWYDLVYRVFLSQDADTGFVEVWLDGVQQEMLNGETRIYGPTMQRPRNYLKAGIYRSPSSTGTTVVEHDNVIVGTSYEAVTAAG